MKLHSYLKSCLLTLGLASATVAGAQSTGSFDTDITFMGQPRKLSCFVPANYNPATSYRLMICLHGLGDNSINYRNALINGLAWNTHFSNTIFICPDGGSDQLKDFYTPAGDEAVIEEAISYAKNNYNINNSEIILQGFSLGGKSALKYGLLNTAKFKGLLLNTPAVQGIKDALKTEADGGFKYSAAANIPIYITHGGQDILYTTPIDSAYEQLVRNNCVTKLVRIASLAHAVPAFSNTPDLDTFFNHPIPSGTDGEIVRVYNEPRYCDGNAALSVLVRNAGTEPITNMFFQYAVGNTAVNPKVHTWTGNLAPFEHAIVSLPALPLSAGQSNIEVTIAAVNSTSDSRNNNTLFTTVDYPGTGKQLPLTEGFEGANFPPQGWVMKPAGDVYSAWVQDDQVKKAGKMSMNAFNTLLIFDNAGRKEEIVSPALDLSSISDPLVAFDVAYNYSHYTASVFGVDTNFADTLEVLVSTDCGEHYTSLYKKGGADLATFATPVENPLTIDASYTNPKAENWRGERISLSNYAGSKDAQVMFRYISALGGCINIDNISFTNKATHVAETTAPQYRLYPNPATDKVMISANEAIVRVEIADMTGKRISSVNNNTAATEMMVNTSDLVPGMYLFQIVSAHGTHLQKVVIRK